MAKKTIHLADDTSLLLDGSEKKIITMKSKYPYFEIFRKIFLDINYIKAQVVLIRCKTLCDNIIRANEAAQE